MSTLLKRILHSLSCRLQKPNKYENELAYWQSRWQSENGSFKNAHFRKIMLAMAEEDNDSFVQDKIIADFGCGPRGSLAWAKSASVRIGIDVLADVYADHFPASILSHGMIYVKSTEKAIPIPSESIDVLFTLNAMDHVDNFEIICKEIVRIIKPGGDFIGSFNIEEPPTPCEPQMLTEEHIKSSLLGYMDILSYRIARQGPEGRTYCNFFDRNFEYNTGDRGYLWVRAKKRENRNLHPHPVQ